MPTLTVETQTQETEHLARTLAAIERGIERLSKERGKSREELITYRKYMWEDAAFFDRAERVQTENVALTQEQALMDVGVRLKRHEDARRLALFRPDRLRRGRRRRRDARLHRALRTRRRQPGVSDPRLARADLGHVLRLRGRPRLLHRPRRHDHRRAALSSGSTRSKTAAWSTCSTPASPSATRSSATRSPATPPRRCGRSSTPSRRSRTRSFAMSPAGCWSCRARRERQDVRSRCTAPHVCSTATAATSPPTTCSCSRPARSSRTTSPTCCRNSARRTSARRPSRTTRARCSARRSTSSQRPSRWSSCYRRARDADYAIRTASIAFKSSRAFLNIIRNYERHLSAHALRFEDIKLNEVALLRGAEVEELYWEHCADLPIMAGITRLKDRVLSRCTYSSDFVERKIESLVDKVLPDRDPVRLYRKLFGDFHLVKRLADEGDTLPDNLHLICKHTRKSVTRQARPLRGRRADHPAAAPDRRRAAIRKRPALDHRRGAGLHAHPLRDHPAALRRLRR